MILYAVNKWVINFKIICNINCYFYLIFLLSLNVVHSQQSDKDKTPAAGSIPIAIKDEGIKNMKKGDVAMIFYITVKNIGTDAVHLSVSNTKCCQTITDGDEDCESMKLYGGDMGELYPQDPRNLTLIFANLILHNRVGSCDIDITDGKGNNISYVVKFDTTLIRSGVGKRIPRLLEEYYNEEELADCESVDEDPLNMCKPYSCLLRYGGNRNYHNHTSQRCQKIEECVQENESNFVAYISETNSCKTLRNTITDEELNDFHDGKPSVHGLSYAHNYPLNIHCNHGERDPTGRWCDCKTGWDSAPLDHASFNPDVHILHMCNIWTGEITASEASNITVIDQEEHAKTTIMVFSILGITFVLICIILGCTFYRRKSAKRASSEEDVFEDEDIPLTEFSIEDDDQEY